jgi:lipopolysaccharide transport protein LptA
MRAVTGVLGLLGLAAAVLAAPGGAGAAQEPGRILAAPGPGGERKPVTISADRLEVDRRNLVARYTGNVVATDRGRCMTIIADQMEFNFDQKMEEIQKAVAQGQVRITYRDKKSVSDRAEYFPQEDRAVLTGRPKVWQQDDLLVGSKIIILFKEDRSIVESDGKERVQAVFQGQREQRQAKRPAPASPGDCD